MLALIGCSHGLIKIHFCLEARSPFTAAEPQVFSIIEPPCLASLSTFTCLLPMAPSAENRSSLPERSPRRLVTSRLTIKQVLYHPLTLLAVGVHVLLLVVPFNLSPSVAPPEKPEEEAPEEAAIDILSLSEISTPEPPVPAASEPPPAPPAAAPPSAALRSAPVSAASPAAAPAASRSAPVSAAAAPAALAPGPSAPATAAPAGKPSPPLPAYDPSADQEIFIGNLGAIGLTDYTAAQGLPEPRFFRQPENASSFLNGTVPAAGAKDARWMDKGPDDVLNQLKTTYGPSGIVFNQLDNYGGELLYQLVTAAGEPFMYISLVSLKGSSLLVIWQGNPLSP